MELSTCHRPPSWRFWLGRECSCLANPPGNFKKTPSCFESKKPSKAWADKTSRRSGFFRPIVFRLSFEIWYSNWHLFFGCFFCYVGFLRCLQFPSMSQEQAKMNVAALMGDFMCLRCFAMNWNSTPGLFLPHSWETQHHCAIMSPDNLVLSGKRSHSD